jgi:hypothetical protein
MFDSTEKKDLRKKYDGMQGKPETNTILGDLKLTEKISNELSVVRNQVDNLNERIEEVEMERDMYKKELAVLKDKHLKQKKMIGVMKEQLGLSFKLRNGVELETDQ